MPLRVRIALTVGLCFLALVVGLIWAGYQRKQAAHNQYGHASVKNHEALWSKIVDGYGLRLEGAALRLAADPGLTEAVRRNDRAALDDIVSHRPLDVAERIEVTDAQGVLLYTSQGQPRGSATLDAGQIARTLAERRPTRGEQMDLGRQLVAVVAVPLPNGAGTVSLVSSLEPALQDLKASLGAEAFIVNRRGRPLMSTDPTLWRRLHPVPRVRGEPLVVEEHQGRIQAIATIPLGDTSGRAAAWLVTVRDDTANHLRRENMNWLAGTGLAVLSLSLAGALVWNRRRAGRGETELPDFPRAEDALGHAASAGALCDQMMMRELAERRGEKRRRRQTLLNAAGRDLGMARRMQRVILPPALPDDPRWEVAVRLRSAAEAGGDFYDLFMLDEQRLGVVLAEASGRGAGAALFMAATRTALRAAASTRPATCLATAGAALAEINASHIFIGALYAVYDADSGSLCYAVGGHLPPLLAQADGGGAEILAATSGPPLGVMAAADYDESTVVLRPGDAVLFLSDGIFNAKDAEGESFSAHRLCQILAGPVPSEPGDVVEAVLDALDAHLEGRELSQDVAVLVLRRRR